MASACIGCNKILMNSDTCENCNQAFYTPSEVPIEYEHLLLPYGKCDICNRDAKLWNTSFGFRCGPCNNVKNPELCTDCDKYEVCNNMGYCQQCDVINEYINDNNNVNISRKLLQYGG